MANKLAGQRAKFSKARAIFYSSGDDAPRQQAARLMAEVLFDAPGSGFSEDEVTQSEDVPDEVRHLLSRIDATSRDKDEDDEHLIENLRQTVDITEAIEIGDGGEFVYAYGCKCAPDRLKIGSCAGDVVARIAAQISTSTPDKPVLFLTIRTHDCRALERVFHGIFRLKKKKVMGAGAEWFVATRDEIISAYESVAKQ